MPADAISNAVSSAFLALSRERVQVQGQQPAILHAQMELAGIAAPTGDEARRASSVRGRLTSLGWVAREDGAGNVIASSPRRHSVSGRHAAPVVVCAHLDTVFDAGTPLAIERVGARVQGPGICDNARGLAVMLALAGAMRGTELSLLRPVELVATTGEEGSGDLRGARHYFAEAPAPFAVIALDGAGDERIVNTALGARRFRIAFRGPGGHSWAAFGAPNPVHAAGRAIAALASLRRPRGSDSSLTVSRVSGGRSVNSIPEEACIEVDARSTSEAVLVVLEREIRAIAAAAARVENEARTRDSAPLAVECLRTGQRPGGVTPADAPLVRAAVEATRAVGRTPVLAAASTDANAAIAAGIPAIAIGGGGNGGDAHSLREWFDDTGSSAGVERALTLVAALASLPG